MIRIIHRILIFSNPESLTLALTGLRALPNASVQYLFNRL
jgi:hypothetical protein